MKRDDRPRAHLVIELLSGGLGKAICGQRVLVARQADHDGTACPHCESVVLALLALRGFKPRPRPVGAQNWWEEPK
jgi:hypothetical protein